MDLPTFRQRIATADLFNFEGDTMVEERRPSKEDAPLLRFTENELQAVDPRLLHACRTIPKAIAKAISYHGVPPLHAAHLRATIDHWLNPKVLHVLNGPRMPYHSLGEFTQVQLQRTPPKILLRARCYKHLTVHDKQNAPYNLLLYTLDTDIYRVCPTWLDQVAPGWKERYVTAETLGYTGKALSSYVLTAPTSTPGADITGMTFD